MFNSYSTYVKIKPTDHRFFDFILLFGLFMLVLPAVSSSQEDQGLLTLEQSVRRVAEIAPEMKAADAEVGKQKGKWEQADAWPNPSVSIQVDDNLSREVGGRGYDVTELAISQPIPLGRLAYQRQQAEAGLTSAEAQRKHQQLMLEYKVAQHFHILQLKEAMLQLAKKRLQQASHYQSGDRKHHRGDPLVRYLTPLETMRLDIVLQAAKQSVEVAEGEFNDVITSFKALLGAPIDGQLRLMPLKPVPTPEGFDALESNLQNHPGLEADKQTVASLEAGIDVAKWQRFADPTVTIFRRNAFLANQRQPNMGIMLSVQVPFWNQNNGGVTQARHAVYQAQAALEINQRDLQSNLYRSYLHLGHLVEQAEHYRTRLLQPAQQVFKLTRKGFDAGELNILTLIDANNTYFDAQARYLTLLQEGWLELAAVRISAGLSLLSNNPETDFGVVK
ncbi:MAG: hypothetical protein CO187_05205 [Zetaproteobacteria bacterium CG_4_9_14_3_um_filter_53_7]|nr:MAG: hypothetical protein CO187_05205 [Zetaproteobacteria bacterium CG_4_9_14_3_um_filter_53_7]